MLKKITSGTNTSLFTEFKVCQSNHHECDSNARCDKIYKQCTNEAAPTYLFFCLRSSQDRLWLRVETLLNSFSLIALARRQMLWKRALISLDEDKSSDLFCGMLMTRQTRLLNKMLYNNIERLKLVPKIFHLSNPEGVEERGWAPTWTLPIIRCVILQSRNPILKYVQC